MFIFHLVGSDVACTQGCSSPLGRLQSLCYLLHDVRLLGTWVRLQPLAFVNAAVVSGLQHRAFCVFTVCLFHTVSNSSYTQSGGVWAVIMVSRGHGHRLPAEGGSPRCARGLVTRVVDRGPPGSFAGPHSLPDMWGHLWTSGSALTHLLCYWPGFLASISNRNGLPRWC